MYPQITQLQTARRATDAELELQRQRADAREHVRADDANRRRTTVSRRVLIRVGLARA